MKTKSGVKEIAKLIHSRGDQEMWGAEGESLQDAIDLVRSVYEEGQEMIEDGCGGYEELQDLLQDSLGLEPDYIEILWLDVF